MPALLEAPTRTQHKQRNRHTWTKSEAEAARLKGLESKRKKAELAKQEKERTAQLLESLTAADPLTHVEKALAAAAKRGNAKACEHLALAVSRLRRTPEPVCGPSPLSSSNYTPTNGIAPRQPTPSTPQVTQAVVAQPCAPGANFAQCREHLVGQAKESLSSETVGAVGGAGARVGAGGGGVSEHITRTAYSSPEQEILALEKRLAELKAQVKQAQVQPVSGQAQASVGIAAVQPVEKFCVGGHWIAGVRKK